MQFALQDTIIGYLVVKVHLFRIAQSNSSGGEDGRSVPEIGVIRAVHSPVKGIYLLTFQKSFIDPSSFITSPPALTIC